MKQKYYLLHNLNGDPSFEVINLVPSHDLFEEEAQQIIKEKNLVLTKKIPGEFEIYKRCADE